MDSFFQVEGPLLPRFGFGGADPFLRLVAFDGCNLNKRLCSFSPTEPRSVDLLEVQALWVTATKGLAPLLTGATVKAVG